MRGKRTRSYGVPVACATTAQSLPSQDNADFAASQRSHFVMKFVGRERGDRSILIARELIRERAGFETKADDSIRIVDAVCAEVRDRTGSAYRDGGDAGPPVRFNQLTTVRLNRQSH